MLRIGARRRETWNPERRRLRIVGPLVAAYAVFAIAVTLLSLGLR